MTKKSVFAGIWGTVLLLAAVLTLGFSLSSCGSDDDDKAPAYVYQGTINGVAKPIGKVKVDTELLESGTYFFILELVGEGNECLEVHASREAHDGKVIDLGKKESQQAGKGYWGIDYFDAKQKPLFGTLSDPGAPFPVFKSGTMFVKRIGTSGTEFEIRIKGIVVGEDGKTEYTVDFGWKGTAEGFIRM